MAAWYSARRRSFAHCLPAGWAGGAKTVVTATHDLDVVAHVDGRTGDILRPSVYAEMIGNSRTPGAHVTGKSVDWVVLRNRLQHIDSHNLRRVGAAASSNE